MVGRQLEFEKEIREVTLGENGNQNYLRLQLIRIPTEFILQTEIQELSLHTVITILILVCTTIAAQPQITVILTPHRTIDNHT